MEKLVITRYKTILYTTKILGRRELKMNSITQLVTSLGMYGYIVTLVMMVIAVPTVPMALIGIHVGCMFLGAYFLGQLWSDWEETKQFDMKMIRLILVILVFSPILSILNITYFFKDRAWNN